MKKTKTVIISTIIASLLLIGPAGVSADTCLLQWTNDETGETFSKPTTETSRTPAAAYQLYEAFNFCVGSQAGSFDGTCYEYSISLPLAEILKSACTTGFWDDYTVCWSSPGCLSVNCSAGGTWDVVCGPQTLISLASFEATPGAGRVVLEWETESETDNAGFNLFRSGPGDDAYVQINDVLIPAEGSPTRGALYRFVDTDVANRTTYSYLLEDVDLNGQATQHDPVSAMPRLIYGIGR